VQNALTLLRPENQNCSYEGGVEMKFRLDDERNWNLDIFQNYQHVENVCKENLICWLDAFNYSMMKQTKVTDFLYRVASRHGMIARDGVNKEIENFKITKVNMSEFLKEYPAPFRNFPENVQTLLEILF
jgi:hypothetical protein